MKTIERLLFVTCLLFLSMLFFGSTSDPKDLLVNKAEATVIQKLEAGGEVEIILKFRTKTDLSKAAGLKTKSEKGNYIFSKLRVQSQNSQKNVRQYFYEEKIDYTSFSIVNAIYLKADLELAREIAKFPEVVRIIENPWTEADLGTTVQQPILRRDAEPEWGIRKILADSVWALGHRGQGIVIGGQDTGYEWTHPALQAKYRGWNGVEVNHNYQWHDAIHDYSPLNADTINPCGLDLIAPCDDHSHGTHTMGIMVGSDTAHLIGVAPEAKWIACRNMERGYGSPATYLECFEWFLAPTDLNNENPNPDMAPHVINNSWSCPEKEGCNPDNFDLLNEAVYNLRQAGIVVVSSAGNDGSGCGTIITPPAIFDESFVVGAIGSDDTIAGFSSRGPVMVDSSSRTKPDVVAPGIWINSSIPGSTYGVKSGTSMAGPHVTGLVALLISAVPELAGQVSTIEHIIESSARVMTTNQDCGDITGQTIPNNTYGYGIVNALEAVRLAKASTAVENQTNRKFALYPNPFYRRINWKLSEKQPQKIEIHDLQGRILVSKNIKPFETNIEADLPPGIYFVTSYISNLKYVTKMVRN